MKFTPQNAKAFLRLFEEVKSKVKSQDGCHHLELWQPVSDQCTILTFSIWESEEDLNKYRSTDFFAETWKRTKALFSEKAEAESFITLDQVD